MKGYKHGGDIYSNAVRMDFSVNTNPQGLPKGVMEAAASAVSNCAAYPDPHCRKLVHAIAKREGIPEEWVLFGNGASDLIYRLAHALMPKRAVLLAPGFSDYAGALRMVDCGIRYHTLKETDNFQLTDAILSSLTADIDLLILGNPNNPTGQLIDRRLMTEIVEQCQEKEIFLMVDECFLGFVEDGERHSLMGLLPNFNNIMVLGAFTKFYACAGLRLGYAFCSRIALLESMKHCAQSWPVSIPAQAAGFAAMTETEYAEKTMEIIPAERQYLMEELQKLSIKTYPSAANYILLFCQEKLYDRLLEKGILIRNCYNYPGLRFGYYRIAVKLHEENQALIEALTEILQGESVCQEE